MEVGAFQRAHKGTLFLDEIGDLNLQNQTKLLRALQPEEQGSSVRKIRRLGGSKEIECDVRVIAATNRDLPTAISKGQFRGDLYWRLVGALIEIPPLRDRGDDIEIIAKDILFNLNNKSSKISRFKPKTLSKAAWEKIRHYRWSGNIREMQKVLTQAVVFSETTVIGPDELTFSKLAPSDPDDITFSRARESGFDLANRMWQIERAFIEDARSMT